MKTIINRIEEYLSVGGLFNPEAVVPQDAVRDLIIDCRDEILRLQEELDEAQDGEAAALKIVAQMMGIDLKNEKK